MNNNYIQRYFKKIGFHLNNFNEKDFLALVKSTKETSRKKNYNQIEMAHHIWLLLLCDYITKEKF